MAKQTTSGEPGHLAELSHAKRLRLTFWESTPKDLEGVDAITWARQNNFLKAFSILGTVSHASKRAHVDPSTVHEWKNEDKFNFRARFYSARECFNEAMENVVYNHIFNTDHPDRVLLLAALKANVRDKWGDKVAVQDERAADLMEKIRAIPISLPKGE